jgi:hypothetical protein
MASATGHVSKCRFCKGAHDVSGDVQYTSKGQPYITWVCPVTNKTSPLFVKAPRGPVKPSEEKPTKGKASESATASGGGVVVQGGPGDDRITINKAPAKPARGRAAAGADMSACKTYNIGLKVVPEYDLCPASGQPIAAGLLHALQRGGIGGQSMTALQAEAAQMMRNIEAKRSCCETEQMRDLGEDLRRILVLVMVAESITPQDWIAMFPAELMETYLADPGAYQQAAAAKRSSGGGGGGINGMLPVDAILAGADGEMTAQPQRRVVDGNEGNDVTQTATGDALTETVSRVSSGLTGATMGARFGPWGAVLGGAAGVFFPELARGAEWGGEQLGLFNSNAPNGQRWFNADGSPAQQQAPTFQPSGPGTGRGWGGAYPNPTVIDGGE